MKALTLTVEGSWAHFKKPESNNNPLTCDIMPKTAFVGLIGAVLGVERQEMKELFPVLCDDLLYGLQLLNPVKKVSWGFTSDKAFLPFAIRSGPNKTGPKYFEFLKNPKFRILVALNNERSALNFEKFRKFVRSDNCIFQPILGWHNCPAELEFESEGVLSENESGIFVAKSFVSPEHRLKTLGTEGFRIGFERIATYQKDFWNFRQETGEEAYQNIIYPDAGHEIQVDGDFFTYSKGGNWWLI